MDDIQSRYEELRGKLQRAHDEYLSIMNEYFGDQSAESKRKIQAVKNRWKKTEDDVLSFERKHRPWG